MTNHLDVYSGYREYLAPFVYGKISQHHIEDTIKVLHEEATTIYGHIEKDEDALAKTRQLEKQHTQRNNKLLKLNKKIKSVSKELNLDMQATTSEIAQKMIPMITPVTSSVEIALAKRQNLKMYREKKSLISTLNYIKGFDHSASDFAKLDFLYPIYRYLGNQLTLPVKSVLAHLACL